MRKKTTYKGSGIIGRLFRNKLAVFGFTIVLVMSLMVICAPLLADHDPHLIDLDHLRLPPQKGYILGTDTLGRDMFARILYGGRSSIMIGLAAALSSAALGISLGCIGGFFGGWIDRILLRFSEFLVILPDMIINLILLTFLGRGFINMLIVFTVTGWMGYYRLVRARFFSIREENFVTALRALRIPKASIMFRHMLPNSMGLVLISFTMSIGGYVLAEAGLAFLGFGIPGYPTWGALIAGGNSLSVMRNYWWLWIPPGITITIFVLGVSFFGDGLRDVLDPKQSRRG